MLDIMSLLLFACALNGILLAAFLFSKKYESNRPNYYLGFFILIIDLYLVDQFVTSAGYLKFVPHIMATWVPCFFLLSPLYYFYVRTILNNQFTFQRTDAWHLLPAIVCFILIIPYYLLPGDLKYQRFMSFDVSVPRQGVDFKIWFHLAFFLQCLIYSIYVIRDLNNTGILEDQRMSRKVVAAVRWLRRFSFIFIIFMCAYLITFTYISFQNLFLFEVLRVFSLLTSAFIYSIVYWSFKKSDLLNSVEVPESTTVSSKPEIENQIIEFFEKDKIHFDPKLDLYTISRRLDMNTQYLSKYIGQTFNCNFTYLVNSYRVEEAKRRMRNPEHDHLSLLGIGMEVGFATKNTFTRAFQKHTGMTPSEFRKSQKKVQLD